MTGPGGVRKHNTSKGIRLTASVPYGTLTVAVAGTATMSRPGCSRLVGMDLKSIHGRRGHVLRSSVAFRPEQPFGFGTFRGVGEDRQRICSRRSERG